MPLSFSLALTAPVGVLFGVRISVPAVPIGTKNLPSTLLDLCLVIVGTVILVLYDEAMFFRNRQRHPWFRWPCARLRSGAVRPTAGPFRVEASRSSMTPTSPEGDHPPT